MFYNRASAIISVVWHWIPFAFIGRELPYVVFWEIPWAMRAPESPVKWPTPLTNQWSSGIVSIQASGMYLIRCVLGNGHECEWRRQTLWRQDIKKGFAIPRIPLLVADRGSYTVGACWDTTCSFVQEASKLFFYWNSDLMVASNKLTKKRELRF